MRQAIDIRYKESMDWNTAYPYQPVFFYETTIKEDYLIPGYINYPIYHFTNTYKDKFISIGKCSNPIKYSFSDHFSRNSMLTAK